MSDPLFDIAGRSIVVAGAASGLGRAVARALAGRGARLTLADISTEGLEILGKELGAEVATFVTDITNESGTIGRTIYPRVGRVVAPCTPTP